MTSRLFSLVLFVLFISCNQGNSQQPTTVNNAVQGEDNEETSAQFKYGEEALQQLIINKLVIPYAAMHYGVNGNIDVEFMIDETGKVASVRTVKSDVEFSDGLNPEEIISINFKQLFALEAERMIWITDTLWNPAVRYNQPTASSQVISFQFASKQFAENNDRVGKNQELELGLFTAGYRDPSAENHYQLGVRLMLDGFFTDAGKHFSYALQLNPQNADAWFNLALCYRKLDKRAEACEAWQKAAELGDTEAAEILGNFCQ